MNAKALHHFLDPGKIQELIGLEPILVLLGLALLAWLIYELLMRGLSADRHRIMQTCFKSMVPYIIVSSASFFVYLTMDRIADNHPSFDVFLPYVGLIAIVSGIFVFVKVCRIFAFIYLFLSHMKVAVPLLLVNIFTLILSTLSVGWLATEIFKIQLAPILATSAILSLVLGLALQDLLGNLFSGIALQFDKPYTIGDWIEVQFDGQKWIGQVNEISWRATLLTAMTEESVTIPNRIMGQAQISNFAAKHSPILRNQVFKIPFNYSIALVKKTLVDAVEDLPGIEKSIKPYVLITEVTESWMSYKVIYMTKNYGSQYLLGDTVLTRCMEALEKSKISIAPHRIQVSNAQV